MKTRNLVILIIILLIILGLFLGLGKKDNNMEDVTGHVVKDVDTGNAEDFGEDDDQYYAGNGTTDNNDDDYEPQIWEPEYDDYTPTYTPPSDSCDEEECDGVCEDDRCLEVACFDDEDCEDDDGCTPSVCYFPGHPNSYCAGPITEERNNDGCCPPGAWVDTDSDCEPVCGNRRCEFGEHTEDCPEDCKHAGGGGTSESSSGGDNGGCTSEC